MTQKLQRWSKTQVAQTRVACQAEIDKYHKMTDDELSAEVSIVCSAISGGSREEKLIFLIKNLLDTMFYTQL